MNNNGGQNGQFALQTAMRQQNAHLAVLHHIREAVLREGGIERHICSPGFQDAEDGNNHFQGAVHA